MAGEANPLSKREQEILSLVARGMTNQEIAKELVISPNTVKVHLRNIFAKLEVASRTEATVKAAQAGWVEVTGLEEEASQAQPAELDRPPLLVWQRIYFVLAAVAVLVALALPGLLTGVGSTAASSDISDASLNQLGPPQRSEVSRWTELAPLPVPRSRLALAEHNDLLYAIGGETAQGVVDSVTVYDPETNGWLPRTSKPTPVANIQAGRLDGLIYVPGGSNATDEVIAALEVYDPIADEWSQRAPLPEPLAGYALAAHEGRLYLFGGWDGTSYVDSAYVYDAQADAWQTLSPLSQAVGFAAAAALGDAIMLVGGYDGRAEYATCRIYRPDEDRYEACASMILPRGGLGLAVDGTSAYAIGGGWERVVTFNERYDSLTDTWSSLTSPIQGQWRTPAVASRGSLIYAVGGWSGGYLDQHEAFQSAFRAFLPLGSRGQQ